MDSIETFNKPGYPQLYNSLEIRRHKGDALMLFKSICKIFNKQSLINTNQFILKSQIIGLELILNIVEKPGPALLNNPDFINIIRT